jgi:phosphoglycerol transferase MdoB-like AlkP superfamily enzyme
MSVERMPLRAYSGDIFSVLIYRLLILYLLYTLSRIGFYVYNSAFFPDIEVSQLMQILAGGLRFDTTAIVYTNLLLILLHVIPFNFRYNTKYQSVLKFLFFAVNGVALAVNCSDFVYYRFTLKRTTGEIFSLFQTEENLGRVFLKSMVLYWGVTLFWLFLMLLMTAFYRLVQVKKPLWQPAWLYHGANVTLMLLAISLVVAGGRGGFAGTTRPINNSNAAAYVEKPNQTAIVLNTPFSVMRTYGKKSLERLSFYPEEGLKKHYDPVFMPEEEATFRPLNVVVIIMESFAREYIGYFNPGKPGYTPFLDSLLTHSLSFRHSYANGRKSIDAMPSVLASIPSLEFPYISSHYATNRINSLAGLLERKGYRTAFFHGAPNGSMGFDAFARLAGFQAYYGMNEYPDRSDYDGIWGVWDEPFFQFFARQLDAFSQPFMAAIFSVSSHHPFRVPDQYEGRFPEGQHPLLKCIAYSDHALKKFFQTASDMPWYRNTLFVITADHTNAIVDPDYNTSLGYFEVPLIFYRPDNSLAGMRDNIAQQIDVMPTVLRFLGFDEPFFAFGSDAMSESCAHFAIHTPEPESYHLLWGEFLLNVFQGKPRAMYRYRTDRHLEDNLIGELPQEVQEQLGFLNAFLQSYNNRLIDNRTTVDSLP